MSPTSPRQPGAGGAVRHPLKAHHARHSKQPQASPSSSTTNSNSVHSSSSSSSAATNGGRHKQPVIIYTHSPKVIRTNPRDFMSIVQKLTGLDRPRGGAAPPRNAAPHDESSSSSSESCAANNAGVHAAAAPQQPYADPQHAMMAPPPPAAYFSMAPPDNIPLFAPAGGSSDLHLCAPNRGLYGGQFPTTVDAAALGPVMPTTSMNCVAGNGGAVFSPSMAEAMRTFPDY